jgi:hypothetical protein
MTARPNFGVLIGRWSKIGSGKLEVFPTLKFFFCIDNASVVLSLYWPVAKILATDGVEQNINLSRGIT